MLANFNTFEPNKTKQYSRSNSYLSAVTTCRAYAVKRGTGEWKKVDVSTYVRGEFSSQHLDDRIVRNKGGQAIDAFHDLSEDALALNGTRNNPTILLYQEAEIFQAFSFGVFGVTCLLVRYRRFYRRMHTVPSPSPHAMDGTVCHGEKKGLEPKYADTYCMWRAKLAQFLNVLIENTGATLAEAHLFATQRLSFVFRERRPFAP